MISSVKKELHVNFILTEPLVNNNAVKFTARNHWSVLHFSELPLGLKYSNFAILSIVFTQICERADNDECF